MVKIIDNNVTAPKGFKASGVYCGIRKNKSKRDLALIFSSVPCQAAACYTLNKVKGAPIYVTQNNIKDGKAQAVICNSGNANTCNADGVEVAEKTCAALASELGISASDVIVASTGVIGVPLDVSAIVGGIPELVKSLTEQGGDYAAEAIITTDLAVKEIAVEVEIGGKTVKIGGIAKGSGMIHPNMATMLSFLTTDCAITAEMLKKALSGSVVDSYNMVTVDGDTSTNDMVSVLANGLAGNPLIDSENEDFFAFKKALDAVNIHLSKCIAADGEGATKLLEINVTNAKNTETAKLAAKAVAASSLVKTAMFGADANWGRILCAVGYAPADIDIHLTDISFRSDKGEIAVCKNGAGIAFSEEKAKEILLQNKIEINIDLKEGTAKATAWGCDLTYDYVKINGDYRT